MLFNVKEFIVLKKEYGYLLDIICLYESNYKQGVFFGINVIILVGNYLYILNNY